MIPEAESTILENLRNPPRTSVIIEIDPATARKILYERNEGNRPRKPNKVQQFSDALVSGQWGLTGDTIKFGTDGQLLDGQNRLAACVRANVSILTHVVFGIDPKLFGRMDIGKPRNAADVLHIAGFSYASTLAAALRWAYLLDTDPDNRETLQPEFVLNLARERYPDIQPFLKYGREINTQFAHPAGQTAALIYKFSKSDDAKAKDFVRAWKKGERNGKYKIIEEMQSLLYSQKANNNNRIHELARAKVIIKTWNIFKLNKKGTKTQLQAAFTDPIDQIE